MTLQEDKEHLFDAFDTMLGVLRVAAGVVATLVVDAGRCRAALSPDMLATDLAYYLVRKGVPFRDAHADAGRVVALAEADVEATTTTTTTTTDPYHHHPHPSPLRRDLTTLTTSELKSVNPLFGDDAKSVFDYEASVEQYDVVGGTARARVADQIDEMDRRLAWWEERTKEDEKEEEEGRTRGK